MEWSPIDPSAQGSSSDWVLQQVCRSCGSSTSMQDIPALPAVSCSLCWSPTMVTVLPQTPVPPVPAPPPDNDPPTDWFSHGPLTRFASQCGWARGDPTPPGSGTQSWLFCPLISLGLALAESRMGVFPYSTGIIDFATRHNEHVLSQINLGLPTHSSSSVHTPLIIARWAIAKLQLHCCSRGKADTWILSQLVTAFEIIFMIAVTRFRQGDLLQALQVLFRLTRLQHRLHFSRPSLLFLGPVTPLTLLLCLPKSPAHSPLLLLPTSCLGLFSPLCRLPLSLLQGALLMLPLLWLQDVVLSTLPHSDVTSLPDL